jgi:hypothetical protein
MRLLVVLAGFAAVIGMATPAQADPGDESGPDATFLSELNKAGVPFKDGGTAVAVGKRACQLMDQGYSEIDVIKNVSTSNPGFSMSDAAKFTTIAVTSYCPQHLGEPTTQAAPPPSSEIVPEIPMPGLPAAP